MKIIVPSGWETRLGRTGVSEVVRSITGGGLSIGSSSRVVTTGRDSSRLLRSEYCRVKFEPSFGAVNDE